MSIDLKQKALYAALLLGPLLAVRLMGPTSMTSASSSAPQPAVAHLTGGEATLSETARADVAELHAAAHRTWLRSQPFGESPLVFTPPPQPTQTQQVQPAPAPRPDVLDVVVTAIAHVHDTPIAVVNGQPVRVGDLVDAGEWRVVAIDPATRAVTFEHITTTRREKRFVPLPNAG